MDETDREPSIDQGIINTAIEDAINSSIQLRIKKIKEDEDSKSLSEDKAFAKAIEGACVTNSGIAAIFLAKNYPHFFRSALIVESQVRNLPQRSFKRGDWSSHAGLVLEDVQGQWHFITPANSVKPYRPAFLSAILKNLGHKKVDPYLTHLRAPSLEHLLLLVEKVESRRRSVRLWPNEEEIQTQINIPTNKVFSEISPGQTTFVFVEKSFQENGEPIISSWPSDRSHESSYYFN